MQKFIFLMAIVCLSTGLAMSDGDKTYIKINQESLSVALLTYKKDNIIVHLIGMVHFAKGDFYQSVRKMACQKIVIYEMNGCNYEQKLKWDVAVLQLPKSYQEQFANIRRLLNAYELAAFAYSLSNTNEVDFLCEANELIHADVPAKGEIASNYSSNERLISYIDMVSQKILLRFNQLPEDSANQLSNLVSARLQNLPELPKFITLPITANKCTDFHRRREALVIKCLQELFNREYLYEEILVIYGAAHQRVFAQFLSEKGFILTHTSWHRAFDWSSSQK